MKRASIENSLRDFGLADKEVEVYIFLGKRGALKGGDIAKQLRMHKGQVYRTLKSLQKKGLVETTLEYPARFTAVPLEKVIESFIKSKREEVARIEEAKEDLLSAWKKVGQTELDSSPEKFSVIEGEKKIYRKISQMIKETSKEFVTISRVYGLVRADQYGIFRNIIDHPLKDKIKFRFLTQVTKNDLKAIKFVLKNLGSDLNVKGRDPERNSAILPRMVIKDKNEILLFISNDRNLSSRARIESALCTNCQSLIESFHSVFKDLWNQSSNIKERIAELESGKPPSKMEVIKDPETAKEIFGDAINQAKEEILIVTSPKRLIELSKNVGLIKAWNKKGVSTKIMAPITVENLKATQKLLSCSEVRHIPIGYRETTIIDEKSLFQFNTPFESTAEDSGILNLENVFFTNDLDYIEQTKKSLFEIWKKTHTPPREGIRLVIRGASSKDSISVNHHPLIEKRAYNINVKHHQIGVISEKDVLKKIKRERKIALRENGKQFDIRRYFGQRAFALIQPPKDLFLPKMIVGLFIDDGLSSSKGQKYMIIDLPKESTKNGEYVPAALIQNTSELLEWRKKNLAGLPVGNNIQVIGKDKFQIQVKGNTLFAGWTIPITLTSKYVLPPACILFEGYGTIKSGIFTSDTPTSRKYEIWYNSIDAFVSFFLPEYKYVGSGTEGFIDVDSVWISKAY